MSYDQQKKWSKWLSLAAFWYNTSYQSAIKTTPFKALYGYEPPVLALGSIPKSQVEAVNVLCQERQEVLRKLKENLRKAQERMKRFADKHRSERSFSVGDWVYLKLQPYRQVSIAGMKNHKLNPKFFGPYEIIEKIGTVAYRLKLSDDSKIHPVFHVSQLKARVGDSQAISPTLPVLGPHENPPPQPQAVLARRMVKRRNAVETQLLIHWSNQETDDATWEDYNEIKRKYPQFVEAILEVEDSSMEGGMSQAKLNSLIAVGVINKEEEKKADKQISANGSELTELHKQTLTIQTIDDRAQAIKRDAADYPLSQLKSKAVLKY